MIVEVKGNAIELRYSLRAVILYENIQGKSFSPQTTTDLIIFMYCVIMTSEKNLDLSFDEFIDMIDNDNNLIVEFSEWLLKEANKNEMFSPEMEEKKTKKKK